MHCGGSVRELYGALAFRGGATVKAGTQERGTEPGTEVRCKVRHDEHHAHIVKAYTTAKSTR